MPEMTEMNTGAGADDRLMTELSHPLYLAKGWLKLLGVMSIIYGAITALSIVGIIIAWLPIWMGVLLWQSAGSIESAYQARDKAAFLHALNKLKLYFTVQGVLLLVGLIGTLLALFVGGGSLFTLLNNMGG